MKMIANNIKVQFNELNQLEVILSINGSKAQLMPGISELKSIIENKKLLSIEVKKHQVKRSLDSNAYLWCLLQEMAVKLHTTKDELYLKALGDYGVFTHLVAKENVVERVKSELKLVKELGKITVNGQTGIQLQVYFGSSTYSTLEMSHLIDGVVQECKDLGINTMTSSELESLKKSWGK